RLHDDHGLCFDAAKRALKPPWRKRIGHSTAAQPFRRWRRRACCSRAPRDGRVMSAVGQAQANPVPIDTNPSIHWRPRRVRHEGGLTCDGPAVADGSQPTVSTMRKTRKTPVKRLVSTSEPRSSALRNFERNEMPEPFPGSPLTEENTMLAAPATYRPTTSPQRLNAKRDGYVERTV